jgi:transposase-like protein
MEADVKNPNTLLDAVSEYADLDKALSEASDSRWPNGVRCPHCGADNPSFLKTRRIWKCSKCRRQFSFKAGTVLEDSPIGLDKWLPAIWLIANDRNGISSWELHRAIGVTQKTAWFMLHRIRLALEDDLTGGMLGGEVGVDESYIGGKARNMHKKKREEMQKKGRSLGNKAVVIGMLERREKGKKAPRVRATVTSDTTNTTMQETALGNVEKGSQLYSDEAGKKWKMREEFEHDMVNHLETYVEGNVHTNGIENFWSLLKRGLGGTYISVEPFHLFRYVDERAFRFNNREHEDGSKIPDYERFKKELSQVVGKRIMYKELIGKEGETSLPQESF